MCGSVRLSLVLTAALVAGSGNAGAQGPPNVSQVLMYSATIPNLTVPTSTGNVVLKLAVPSVYTENGVSTSPSDPNFGNVISNGANFTVSKSFLQVSSALNASIATALSIIPLSSPASGVIDRTDPTTGAQLAESSTLGPIFTERAETIGKGHFYLGFSNQDFHFTKFNGVSLNALSVLYTGGDPTKVSGIGNTVPASFGVGMDVRLSQNIAFLTYGVTDRFDISVGLPMVHSAVASRTFNGTIYAGNGFLDAATGNLRSNGSACWCANTFTPGYPTLTQPLINQASASATGLGDVLIRAKGTVLRRPGMVIGVGADLRLPTGDAQNYLGVGTTSVKPFVAVSLYSKPLAHGVVLSPHFDAGWQFSGKSQLGGQLQGTNLTQNTSSGPINYVGAPFTWSKGYIPDVFNWAVGVEVALGRRNTLIADVLGNQIGWIHGIANTATQTLTGVALPTSTNGDPNGATVPTKASISGLISAGSVSFGQYSASFGYKYKVVGNLIANFNLLVRMDNNGLTARVVPLFGLGYSF
jgi:hypothetical protein